MIQELFSNIFVFLNNSKLFSAFIMVIMNLGSKYIAMDLNIYIEKFLSSYIIRKIAFFSIFWMATKDILLSIILTFIISFVIEILLNEKSKFCIIPKKEIFMNKYNNPVSIQDYNHAKDIINKYENNYKKYEYFSNLFEISNKKKHRLYMINKIKLNELKKNKY
jgi:hypothetical protein